MNWQAGIMLHPGAQRSEHRIKAPACRETQQAGTVTTSWQSGRQHGAQPQHHLGISLRLAPTQHNHCIPLSQNNLKPLSEKRGEDQRPLFQEKWWIATDNMAQGRDSRAPQ